MVLSTPDFPAPARPQSHTLPVTLLKIHTVEGHFILPGSPSNLFTIHYAQERRAWCHLLDLSVDFKATSRFDGVTVFSPGAVFGTRELLTFSWQGGVHSPILMQITSHFMTWLHLFDAFTLKFNKRQATTYEALGQPRIALHVTRNHTWRATGEISLCLLGPSQLL